MARTARVVLGALLLASSSMAAALKSDEQVLFLPQVARLDAQLRPQVQIEAFVYELERRPGATSALARWLDLDPAQLSIAERQRLYDRTQLFRIDFESGKALAVQCAGMAGPVLLPPSGKQGRSHGTLQLPSLPEVPRANAWIDCPLVLPAGDPRRFGGRALLLAPQGLSIVSDIDDTIKHSAVRDRHALLMNTFVREFAAVAGMAALYRRHAEADARTAIHYVSGSPKQLYPVLDQFLREAGFPPGTMHLRNIDLSDELLGTSSGTVGHKRQAIGHLLRAFPQRRFVLVGDSGEHDPEIYGALARRYPQSIEAIRIRAVSGEARAAERYRRAFRGVPEQRWALFRDAGEARAGW